MTNNEKTFILYVHETTLQSWARDLGTFICVVGIIGVGWFFESPAMEWAGFIMVGLLGIARLTSHSRGTPQEVADWILEKWGVVARAKKTEAK